MVKRFISVSIILTFFITLSNLFPFSSKDDIRFYKIKIRLCRQINDKACQLKYYSYLYDIADDNLRKSIKSDVSKIISTLNEREFKKIKLNKFKKNWVYYAVINNFNKKNNIDRIKVIGVCIPLSREFKFIGENILKGILAGINFFENPLDVKIKLFDTMKLSSGNLEKLREFLNNNKDIQIIVGFPIKKNTEAAINILKNAKLPVIFLNDDFVLAKSSPYFFNHFININDEMKKLCEVIKENEILNLAVVFPENYLGLKYKSSFFNNCSLNVKAVASYSPDSVDFRNILFEIGKIKKIKDDIFKPANKIDGFLILDKVEKAILIIPQIYFYDFKNPKIYGIDLWNNKKLFKLDKKFLKNITFIDCIDYNSLKKNYNNLVDFYSVLAYDTIQIINSISNINELNTKIFNLLSGETYFDKYGIAHKSMKIFKINNGGIYVQ